MHTIWHRIICHTYPQQFRSASLSILLVCSILVALLRNVDEMARCVKSAIWPWMHSEVFVCKHVRAERVSCVASIECSIFQWTQSCSAYSGESLSISTSFMFGHPIKLVHASFCHSLCYMSFLQTRALVFCQFRLPLMSSCIQSGMVSDILVLRFFLVHPPWLSV